MSVRNPYKRKEENPFEELQEEKKQNRSTLYHFFKEQDFPMRFWTIGNGRYKVFQAPYKWDQSFLMINNMRITDFQSVVLFSSELVVRFSQFNSCQINIPYKDIDYIAVSDRADIGYQELYMK